MSAVKDIKSYHMITCILAMLACCGFSVHVAMILAQPISQHEAVSTIFISVLIGFRYIRAPESLIHRITCCTYGVLYDDNTILVCRLVNQMHISGMHLTLVQDCSNSSVLALELVQSCTLLHCRYNLTKLPLSPSHNWFWNVFLFTKWDDHWSLWKIVISFINHKCLVMYLRLGPFCAN